MIHKKYQLGQIASCQTGPFGTQLHEHDYVAIGTPIVTVEHLGEVEFSHRNLPFVSDADKQRLIKYSLNEGDIVFSRVGSVDRSTYVRKDEDGWLFSGRCIRVRCNSQLISSRYLSFYFRHKSFKEMMRGIAVGATMPSLNTSLMNNITLFLPEFHIQQRVAELLDILDKKITLNNRINAELEAMAKTLYDYWFVQFDFPDAKGKPYKTSGGKMVYNPTLKREIPEGWSIKTLSQIANITMGQSPDGDTYNDEEIGTVFFQGSTDFGWLFPTTRQFTTAPARMAIRGDILLSVRAPVGDMNIAKIDCCIGRGLAALNSKTGSDGFLFYVMKYFKQIFDRHNSAGTTFGSITKDDLHSLQLVYPDAKTLQSYDGIVSNYNKMIYQRSLENEQLTALRDWLLPMLMSGQVTIKC
jgi:type I restriction enzyme, S subunit